MKKGIFICFAGIDGSGKTTLANALVDAFKNSAIKYKYVYNRYRPVMLKPFLILARSLLLPGKDTFKDYTEDSDAKRKIFKNRILSSIYQSLLLLDYSIQIFIKVAFPLSLGRNIVCDRYVYDTICTDLAVDLDYSVQETKWILEKCIILFPRPDVTFLVDVPEEIAYTRKNDIPSIDYLKERRKIYLSIAKEHDMIILNGIMQLDDLKSAILAHIRRLSRNG